MLPISALPQPLCSSTAAASRLAPAQSHSLWWGLCLCAGLGAGALRLGEALPLIGGPVLGILLGLIWRNTLGVAVRFRSGVAYSSRQVLKWSIIGLGFGLSFTQVLHTGASSLAVTLTTLTLAFIAAWLLGRWLKLNNNLCTLIGVGTAICGGSAIAAVAPIVKSDGDDTALALSTIFLFNIIAVLVFPALGHWMGLSDAGFGLWAGTAINDTSSVVAAGYSYSTAAGDAATIVKLTRASLIIPVCLVLAVWTAWRARQTGTRVSLGRIFPWFILWFLLASAARSAGLVPTALLPLLHDLAQFLIVMALTAVGLSSDLRRMALAGARPLLLGLGVWAVVAAGSLTVQALLNHL